jgi:hypothetical protein
MYDQEEREMRRSQPLPTRNLRNLTKEGFWNIVALAAFTHSGGAAGRQTASTGPVSGRGHGI